MSGVIFLFIQNPNTFIAFFFLANSVMSCVSYMNNDSLVVIVGVVLRRLDTPSDMSAADMPTCRPRDVRHVGDMSNVLTCPRQHWKTSVLMR